MSERLWPTRPLGDVGEWLSGGTPPKDNSNLWTGSIPWVSPKDMKAARIGDTIDHVSQEAIGNGTRLVPPKTLLMVVRGMILAHTFPVAITTRAVAFNQDLKALKPGADFEPDFLLYWLQSAAPEALRHVDVANHGTRRLPTESLFRIVVPVPPLAEQRTIAAILSSVDEVIEKTEAVIEQLQLVRQAMTQELMTRGLPRRHTRFKHTEVGQIPEGWNVARLVEVGVVQTGIAKGKKPGAGAVEVPYLRVANVQDGYLDLRDIKTLAVEPTGLDRYSLRSGDVLFTEGGDADKLGRGAVWHAEIKPCLHQNHIFAVRCDGERLLPEFLSYYGGSPAGKAYFLDAAKQTTNLASINSTQLKALPVPLPQMDEQRSVVRVISAVDERIGLERDLCRRYKIAKSSLMSLLLTGQVRVGPEECAA